MPEIDMKSSEAFDLKGFSFDRALLELRDADGEIVALRRQSAEVLAELLAQNCTVVAKDALLAAVWPDVAVTDDSLTQCIADIRKAIGDHDHRIIQTFTRKGYRANAELRGVAEPSEAPGAPQRRGWPWVAVVGLVAVVAVAVAVFFLRPSDETRPANDIPSIAVLAFDDFSTGEDAGYLSDAIPEGIITELARNGVLRVIARNSSFVYRAQPIDVRRVGEELGVQYVLEGSQQKSGEQLRVTVQLIDATTAEHIWTHTYYAAIGELFVVQDEIIRTVADRVGARIEERPLVVSDRARVSALALYMEGLREVRRNFSPEGNERNRALSERAIEVDPDSPFGYIGLAWSYRHDAVFGWNGADREEALSIAEEFADRAIELAPDNSEAHFIRARLHEERGEFDQANQRYARAIDLNPSDANVLNGSASPLLYVGRIEEGIERIEQAMGIDPFHPDHFHWQMSWALWENEDCDASVQSMERMDRIPDPAQRMYAAALACAGDVERAQEALAIFLATSNQATLSAERTRLEGFWTATDSLDRWIEDLRTAGMPE
jgi:TolB-like protein/DNA-binding winged helix-turn-helix (wHTH) protein